MTDVFTSAAPFTPGPRLTDGSDLNKALANPALSVESGIVATGTTVADAFQLKATINQLATVAASTGVKLPLANIGQSVTIYNDGASAVTIYDAHGLTIDGTAGATGVALTNALRAIFTRMTATNWESAQLGVVSA